VTSPGLRVLITNGNLWPLTGTVLYVRDLALELQRQGHTPAVFSTTTGAVADELGAAGIPVVSDLRQLDRAPDIIQGHHHAQTMLAVRQWRAVPAIFVCHDHLSSRSVTPLHRRIRRYFGVSQLCVDRLVREGVPPGDAALLLNFVDTKRFVPRPALPTHARRALVFSNYANEGTHLPAVRAACREAGLELDVVGYGVGNMVHHPEAVLGAYDIVFAKAKAAMEAMAVGTAVVLCDSTGVGPMVTSAGFDDLRPLNFGFQALRDPIEPGILLREIARYDAVDAERVRERLRSSADLERSVADLVAIYRAAIAEHGLLPGERWSMRQSLFRRFYWTWKSLPPAWRTLLRDVAVVRWIKGRLRRLADADESPWG